MDTGVRQEEVQDTCSKLESQLVCHWLNRLLKTSVAAQAIQTVEQKVSKLRLDGNQLAEYSSNLRGEIFYRMCIRHINGLGELCDVRSDDASRVCPRHHGPVVQEAGYVASVVNGSVFYILLD